MSVQSPCVSVCRMRVDLAQRSGDEHAARRQGLCEGCLRTMDEIVAWGTLADAQREQVWSRIQGRADRLGCPAPVRSPGVSR